jgi:hypothetical protein
LSGILIFDPDASSPPAAPESSDAGFGVGVANPLGDGVELVAAPLPQPTKHVKSMTVAKTKQMLLINFFITSSSIFL